MRTFEGTLLFLVMNPWIHILASRLIFNYGAGFTSPDSPQRYAVFIVLCLYVWLTLANFTAYVQSTSYFANIIAGIIFNLPLTYFDRLILRKWRFEDRRSILAISTNNKANDGTQRPTQTANSMDEDDTISSRFAFANEVGGTVRGPGTSWEVKGIPHFSNSDPRWIPSPLTFTIWKLGIMIGCFLLYDHVVDVRLALEKDLLQPSCVPFIARIGEVTWEEVWTRVVVNVTFWVSGYCVLQLLFSIPAIIAVCLNPESVEEWRPAFGTIFDAFTLRKFWG